METSDILLDRIIDLEKQLAEQRVANELQRQENKRQRQDKEQLKKQIAELKEALKAYADSKTSKPPKITLNYSSERNEPPEKTNKQQKKKKKKRKKAGRKPKSTKHSQVGLVTDILLEGFNKSDCILHREQFVWRIIDHKAVYVHYRIYTTADAVEIPSIPGVRNAWCGYGLEFIIMLAHHVYWMGLQRMHDFAKAWKTFRPEVKHV